MIKMMMRTRKKMRQLTLIKKMKKTLIRRKMRKKTPQMTPIKKRMMQKKIPTKKMMRRKTLIKKKTMQRKKLIRNQKAKRKMTSTIERPHQRRKKMTNPRIKSSALIPKQRLLPQKSLR